VINIQEWQKPGSNPEYEHRRQELVLKMTEYASSLGYDLSEIGNAFGAGLYGVISVAPKSEKKEAIDGLRWMADKLEKLP